MRSGLVGAVSASGRKQRTRRMPLLRKTHLPICVLLCALGSVALAQEDFPEPAFKSGKWGWYPTELRQPEVTERKSACDAYGEHASAYPLRGGKPAFRCTLSAELTPDVLTRCQEALAADEQKPPSKQAGAAAVWKRELARVGGVCPRGFGVEFDGNEVVCRKVFTAGEFCPNGGTPAASTLVAGCGVVGCEASDLDLSVVTKGQYRGCFFCPVGELDLKETVAWNKREGGNIGAVLCKGPAALKVTDLRKPKEGSRDDDSNRAELEAGCAKGKPSACVELAEALRAGTYGDPDQVRALAAFEGGCAKKLSEACVKGAEAAEEGLGDVVKPDFKRAVKFYRAACDVGSLESCNVLGVKLLEGEGYAHDSRAAQKLFEKACQAGDATGCFNQADGLLSGTGTAKNLNAGLKLLDRACEGGIGDACFEKGRRLNEGDELKEDAAAALIQFRRACTVQHPVGCFMTANLLSTGRGAARDLRAAAELHERACLELRVANACHALGSLYVGSEGLGMDEARASRFLGLACDSNVKTSCISLGAAYEHGLLGAPRADRAAEFYAKACAQRDPEGCEGVGRLNSLDGGQP